MTIEQPVRSLPVFKKMRLHLVKCAKERKLPFDNLLMAQFNRSGNVALNPLLPPLYKYVPMKNDPAKIKLPNGKYNQKYYREQKRKRDIEAAVAAALRDSTNMS